MHPTDLATIKKYYGSQYPQTRYSYGSNSLVEYIGIAPRGSLSSEAVWIIAKFTYDGSNNVVQAQTSVLNSIWDDRATTVIFG